MIEKEFVRNLNCNYERIPLEDKPEENRYQYCIVTRGGIKGLLPCSLRYINGQAYLYYDISSTQSICQLHADRPIGRQWMKDFLWGMQQIRRQMERFLLDDGNILWYPDQIFQDVEKNDFYFLYIPYYEGDSGLGELMDYLVEHVDYEDAQLVEFVYKMHEQYNLLGEVYLKDKVYEDSKRLDEIPEKVVKIEAKAILPKETEVKNTQQEYDRTGSSRQVHSLAIEAEEKESKEGKRGIRYFWEGKLKRQKEDREGVYYRTNQMMAGCAVCEESEYTTSRREPQTDLEEELGRTMYMEEVVEEAGKERADIHGLYTQEGELVFHLEEQSVILGKKKEEADCVLEDHSVSRMHARITMEKDGFYLEDLNSTNGTCKNGLRLQPYEKRKLESEDEVRLGKVVLIFR